MEKKQLIIIPPTSEALKKLHEILESIANEENIEISLIDDLKELTQFISNSGQCLILASNAKKCAQFLQENKSLLARNHCKTILFTPKEIPAKTLIKFTKTGLTESILEGSAPKTILYKVKLLLRSIKTQKAAEEKDREVIKSLADANKMLTDYDDTSERDNQNNEFDSNDETENYLTKKDKTLEGESIDYGNPFKGKIKAEEDISTNWKSDLKKPDASLETEDLYKKFNEAAEEIDLHYRGTQKQHFPESDLSEEEDTARSLREIEELLAAEKKRQGYRDVIDEGLMKEKSLRNDQAETEEDEDLKSLELDIIMAQKKNGNKQAKEDEIEDSLYKEKIDLEISHEDEEADLDSGKKDNLDGYLKGKIKKEIETSEQEDFIEKKKYEKQNSGLSELEELELLLLEAQEKKRKMSEEEASLNDPHKGSIDHIDNSDMIGKEGSVEKIETYMEGDIDPSLQSPTESENVIDFLAKKLNAQEEERSEKEHSKLKEEELKDDDLNDEDKKIYDPNNRDNKRPTPFELDLEDGEQINRKQDEEEDSSDHSHGIDLNLQEQARSNGQSENSKKLNEDDDLKNKKINNSTLAFEESKKANDGKNVDNIDKYMRGGAANNTDQDWNINQKKESFKLASKNAKRPDEESIKAQKKSYEESVIDYRQLKEEFDEIANGPKAADGSRVRAPADDTLRQNDDEGQFKVVEIDPRCLDFAILYQSSIFQKDIKTKNFFSIMGHEIFNQYKGLGLFYTFKLSDKKFIEVYNAFNDLNPEKIPELFKEKYNQFKEDSELFKHFQTHTMTMWRCAEIKSNNEIWEDVELPSWAQQELMEKPVELVFPYFDGIDRMGMAIILFPHGINPKETNGLLTTLEMARTLFLDTIERYQVKPLKEAEEIPIDSSHDLDEKKGIKGFLGNLFGTKKAN